MRQRESAHALSLIETEDAVEHKINVEKLMNDQMKAVIVKQNELASDAFATDVGLEEMRANYIKERRFWNEGGPVMSETVDDSLEGPLGTFKIRRYYPQNDGESLLPGIIFIHGGGFVVGNCDTHDRVCRILAHLTGAAVVSVDYHLSPESKYPTNIQECAVVAKYLHAHGRSWGIDGNDLSFAGDSGGAVLAMATNLWLRDEEGDNSFITTLLLYYGFYGLIDSASRRLYGGKIDGMSKGDLDYYNKCWLGEDDAAHLSLPYVDMLANDLKTSMPACYIASADLDPLRDDSICLYHSLLVENVPCQYENFKGVLHAFIHYTRMLDESNQLIEHSADFWRAHHGHRM